MKAGPTFYLIGLPIVLPALLLHDVGWSTVPDEKVLYAFGPNMRYPELRRQHEVEGVRIAREILSRCEFDPMVINQVVTIIDGHDTRKQALSLNDSIFKDCDKLWAFTPFGLETIRAWFNYTIPQYLDMLTRWLDTRFYTEAGGHMAHGLFAALQMGTLQSNGNKKV